MLLERLDSLGIRINENQIEHYKEVIKTMNQVYEKILIDYAQ